MKRIFSTEGGSEALKRALAEYRRTHEKISREHPDLLPSMRRKLAGAYTDYNLPQEIPDPLVIDRRKNLETIARLMEIKMPSPAFHAKLRQALLDTHK